MPKITDQSIVVLRVGSALDVFGPTLTDKAREITSGMAFILTTDEETPAITIAPGDAMIFTGTSEIHSVEEGFDILAQDVPIFRIANLPGKYIISLE